MGNTGLVVLLVMRAMVQIEEAEVPCSYSAASLVHVHVVFYFAEPVEGLGDQDVLFEEDAALFVQNVEDDEPPPDVLEVVLEVALRLLRLPLLEQPEGALNSVRCFWLQEAFVVLRAEHVHLEGGLGGAALHGLEALLHKEGLALDALGKGPQKAGHCEAAASWSAHQFRVLLHEHALGLLPRHRQLFGYLRLRLRLLDQGRLYLLVCLLPLFSTQLVFGRLNAFLCLRLLIGGLCLFAGRLKGFSFL